MDITSKSLHILLLYHNFQALEILHLKFRYVDFLILYTDSVNEVRVSIFMILDYISVNINFIVYQK